MKSIDEKFKSEKEKKEAISELEQIVGMAGWKLLKEFLEEDIKEIEGRIFDTDIEDPKELKFLKSKRAHLIILKELPEELIKILKGQKSETIDFDPYYKKIEDVKK